MQLDPNGFNAKYLCFPFGRKRLHELPSSFCTLFWNNVGCAALWLVILFFITSPASAIANFIGYGPAMSSLMGVFGVHVVAGTVVITIATILTVAILLFIIVATVGNFIGALREHHKSVAIVNGTHKSSAIVAGTYNVAKKANDQKIVRSVIGFIGSGYRRIKDRTCPMVDWTA